jgi:N-acetylglucosaminyldiphosphoundecaprenol N-acetyl-beta-D-mannosaminyltransferase
MAPLGLEWTFRLAQEPTRLWRRYARYNPRFVAAFLGQYLRNRRDRRGLSV